MSNEHLVWLRKFARTLRKDGPLYFDRGAVADKADAAANTLARLREAKGRADIWQDIAEERWEAMCSKDAEIESLRALVEAAYREGHGTSANFICHPRTVENDNWLHSDTRAALDADPKSV